ncbi:hypothetical protein [Acetobacter cibinongensis]|uniref:Helix-turn-helix domain-containing protein n=1 Tax=Acetobacter cibinongensis TaxID=146475 RepID=A0A1Z5YW18_9PROT|nr:hypothetical protein [Acetobacter cibinongensis]OUJ03217.1 hypothetical protein HK14_02785 [Acetobacter cibinongensis]
MHSAGSSTGRLISFPGRPVLSRQDAVRYLGASATTFWALRTLRCAPAARMLDGRLVYRTEELEQFKTSLMRTVGVGYSNSPYQPTAERTAVHPLYTASQAEEDTSAPDPLMQLLARATIRHRMILLTFWSMILTGGLCTLILF